MGDDQDGIQLVQIGHVDEELHHVFQGRGIQAAEGLVHEQELISHATLSKEVASIRAGTGYRDTASDLIRLARIYEDQKAKVETDPLNYRDTDAAEARALAHDILTELGKAQSAEEQRCVGDLTRAWTLLRDTYGEAQWAGQFLYRHEEPEAKFPSLYASSGGGRPKKVKEPTLPPTGDGSASGGGK